MLHESHIELQDYNNNATIKVDANLLMSNSILAVIIEAEE